MSKKSNFHPHSAKQTLEKQLPDDAEQIFPVVGVGASAGGLDAFTKLLKNLPADTGMTFVLVQHLDPKHTSMLPELLSRASHMPASEIADGTRIERNHVYVMPPNYSLAMLHGVLHSAIAAGHVDFVLPPEEIGKELVRIARHPYLRHEETGPAGERVSEGGDNLMIYLGAGLQKKVLHTFHYALRPGRFLMLGTSEIIGSFADLEEEDALKLEASTLVPEKAQEQARDLIERLKHGKHVPPFETLRRTRDGREIKAWLTTSVLLGESGSPAAIATTEKEA